MRIGIAYLEYSRRKGVERISAEVADQIARQGHEVHFHCARWLDASSSRVQFHKVPTLDVVNSARLFSFALLGKGSLDRGRYDITLSYGNVIGCDIVTAQSCHRAGLEVAERSIAKDTTTRTNFGIADRLRLMMERQNYGRRKYRKVIACSTLVKRELVKYYGVPESDIVVISNGVDTNSFHPRNREMYHELIRGTYGVRKQDILLLFVGHEFGRKGLKTVLESMVTLKNKNIKLLVCGGDHATKFQKFVAQLGLQSQVIFVGPQVDIKPYYAAADISVLPTLHEAFGLVITEAMASGLPVVVSRSAGAAEDIIEDGRDGILLDDPLNAAELAQKISLVAEDRSLRSKIGMRGHEKVQRYTWESYSQKVLEVIEEVRHRKSL